MATIATSVQWGSSPKIYFDFSYDKKREGSTQYYSIGVSCHPLNSGTSYFGYPIYVEISLDGVVKTSYTLKNASPNKWSAAISNSTGWLSVANKTIGTTSLTIRIFSGSGSSRTATYSYSLAVDPAASTITCTKANIESNPTITISRASSSFTHTIEYSFGSLSGTIVTKTSATSITSWKIPSSFYGQIPNNKEGWGILTCYTYSGSTLVGSYPCEFWVSTNESKCKPTVSGSVVDDNPTTAALTGNADKYLVRYFSNAKCTMNATLNNSAGSFRTKTINNVSISGNTLTFNNVETGVFDFYAKDSREYHNSDKETKTLIQYIRLTVDATAQRTDPTSGNATITIKGNYFNGSFGAVSNSLTVKYRQGNSGNYTTVTPTITNNTYSVNVPLTGRDYTKSFNYEVVVSDKLSSITKTLTLQKGTPVFDWGENDFNFNVPVTIKGVNILEKLAELEKLVKG